MPALIGARKTRNHRGRYPGRENSHQVRSGLRVGSEVRESARIQYREQLLQLRALHRRRELTVVYRRLAIEIVLFAHRHDYFINQRVAQAGHLNVRPGSGRDPRGRIDDA